MSQFRPFDAFHAPPWPFQKNEDSWQAQDLEVWCPFSVPTWRYATPPTLGTSVGRIPNFGRQKLPLEYINTGVAQPLGQGVCPQSNSLCGRLRNQNTHYRFPADVVVPGPAFTLVVTFVFISTGTNGGIWRDGPTGGGTTFAIIRGADDEGWFRVSNSNIFSSGTPLQTGKLIRIAFVFKPDTYGSLWENGKRISHAATAADGEATYTLRNIGTQFSDDNVLHGDWIDFRWYTRTLPDAHLERLTGNTDEFWDLYWTPGRVKYFSAGAPAANDGAAFYHHMRNLGVYA